MLGIFFMPVSFPSSFVVDGEDDAEFAQVYSRSLSALRPALSGRLGSRDEADDVLHDAFVRFLHSYSGKRVANPLGLIARITMNIIRDNARSRKFRQQQSHGLDMAMCRPRAEPDPEMVCLDRQSLGLLCAAVDALPPRCREVLLLHRIEGMAQSEVARLLGISRSAVEKHLARADARLRRDLGEEEPGGGVDSAAGRKA
jgi:RNA polymerase sigma factor (sigma-70 family)